MILLNEFRLTNQMPVELNFRGLPWRCVSIRRRGFQEETRSLSGFLHLFQSHIRALFQSAFLSFSSTAVVNLIFMCSTLVHFIGYNLVRACNFQFFTKFRLSQAYFYFVSVSKKQIILSYHEGYFKYPALHKPWKQNIKIQVFSSRSRKASLQYYIFIFDLKQSLEKYLLKKY